MTTRRIIVKVPKKKLPKGMKHGVRPRKEHKEPLNNEEKRLHRERNKEDEGKVAPKWRKALRQARNDGIIGSIEPSDKR